MTETNTETAAAAALVAPALARVEASPFLPSVDQVWIYFRIGRRFTRVFWAYSNADSGSILVFVENATGRVYTAKSSTMVGRQIVGLVWS